jgi:hypothetical protein
VGDHQQHEPQQCCLNQEHNKRECEQQWHQCDCTCCYQNRNKNRSDIIPPGTTSRSKLEMYLQQRGHNLNESIF